MKTWLTILALLFTDLTFADDRADVDAVAEIKQGEEWLARDGSVWRILATDSAIENYPVVAMNLSTGKVEYYTAQGRAHLNGAESPRDLIEVNVPKILVKNWTIIIRGTPAECTLNKEVADQWKADGAEVLELSGEWRG